jgi:hypothetical protein
MAGIKETLICGSMQAYEPPVTSEAPREPSGVDPDPDDVVAGLPRSRPGGWVVAIAMVGAAGALTYGLWTRGHDRPPPSPSVESPVGGLSAIPEAARPNEVPTAEPVAPRREPVPDGREPLTTNEMLHRALVSMRREDLGGAEKWFRLALERDPFNVEANTGLGDIARRQNDLPRARDGYQRAVDRSPTYIPALLALADVRWDLGESKLARAHYIAVVERLGDRAPRRATERASPEKTLAGAGQARPAPSARAETF